MSENIVQLSDGAYAKLRPAADIPEGLRRPVLKAQADMARLGAMNVESLTGDDIETYLHYADLLIVAFVVRWTCKARDEDGNEVGDVLPITLDSLAKLRGRDVDALRNQTTELGKAIVLDFGASAEPTSPTAPSNGSSTPSVEGQLTGATESQTSGEPTA